MLNYIKDEPYIKKNTLLLIICIALIIALNLICNYFFIEKVYNDHLTASKKLVGAMVMEYPKDEIKILNIATRKTDNPSYAYGNDIFKKYGYDNEVTAFKNETFKNEAFYMLISGIFCSILTLGATLYVLIKSNLHIIRNLHFISDNITSVINGNFSVPVLEFEEGILSKINIQFYQMARILNSNIDKLKGEKENIKSLVTDISHQLKTPLAAIKIYNTILIEDDITNEEKEEFLQTSKNEINKLEWLLNSLLKLSKLEAGMIELKIKDVPLTKTIFDAVNSLKGRAMEKGIKIITKVDKEYYVRQDERWTKEALSNVIENAIKYINTDDTKTDGLIEIKVFDINTYVRIDISDNGIGIPQKNFNDIFKRFFRGDSEIVKNAEGSGVGLYLTRKILESQGGSIIVDSSINKGTTFSLFLEKA